MSYELRPCLRCGIKDEDWSNNIVTSTEWEGEIITGYWIICECGLSIFGVDEKQAVERWNTRPVEDALLAKLNAKQYRKPKRKANRR